MAYIIVEANKISMASSWNCQYWMDVYDDPHYSQSTPSTDKKTIRFKYSLPEGANIRLTRVYSKWAGESYGYLTRTVNDKNTEINGSVVLDNPSSASGYIDVVFKFQSGLDDRYRHFDHMVAYPGTASTNHTSTCTVSNIYLRIDYDPAYTACTPPTSVTLSKAMSTGELVELSWSGATAGTNNEITGYLVQRSLSVDGVNWSNWEEIAQPVSSPLDVEPPSTLGHCYKYRVRTLGSAGSSYYSDFKESLTALLRMEGFTDDPLEPGITPVKALHMHELQERAAILRNFYGLEVYTFTSIVSGVTAVGNWSTHVTEIRAAIDEIGRNNVEWLPLVDNTPRADVIHQLREIIMSI